MHTINPAVIIDNAGSAEQNAFSTRESFLAIQLQAVGQLDQDDHTYLLERYADFMESVLEVADQDGLGAVDSKLHGDMKAYWMETRRPVAGVEVRN